MTLQVRDRICLCCGNPVLPTPYLYRSCRKGTMYVASFELKPDGREVWHDKEATDSGPFHQRETPPDEPEATMVRRRVAQLLQDGAPPPKDWEDVFDAIAAQWAECVGLGWFPEFMYDAIRQIEQVTVSPFVADSLELTLALRCHRECGVRLIREVFRWCQESHDLLEKTGLTARDAA